MIGKLPADRLSDPAGKKRFQIRAFFNTIPASDGQNFFFLIAVQHLPRNRPPPVLFLSAGHAAQGCAAMPLPLHSFLYAGPCRTRMCRHNPPASSADFMRRLQTDEGIITAPFPSSPGFCRLRPPPGGHRHSVPSLFVRRPRRSGKLFVRRSKPPPSLID